MTAEKRLESTLRALRLNWDESLGIPVDHAVNNPTVCLNSPFVTNANKALLELYIDASNELEKKTSPKSSIPALKRFLKDDNNNNRFNGIDNLGDVWYISSMYRAVKLSRKPEGIAEHSGHPYAASVAVIMDKALREARNETEAPSVADVKRHIADFNSKKHVKPKYKQFADGWTYNLPETDVWVDPQKLIDMLSLFPDSKIYTSAPLSPIVFKSNDPNAFALTGILMPIRHIEESNETESA